MVKITLEFPDKYYAKLWWDWYTEGGGSGAPRDDFEREAAEDEFGDGDSLDLDIDAAKKVIKYQEVGS